MRPGNVIRIKRGVVKNFPTGSRYAWGLILEVHDELTRWNGTPEVFLKVLWVDGHVALEDFRNLSPSYEVIDETR